MTEQQPDDKPNPINTLAENNQSDHISNPNFIPDINNTTQSSPSPPSSKNLQNFDQNHETQNHTTNPINPDLHVTINVTNTQNNHTAAVYTVNDGDTLDSIAGKFHITTNWLKRQNSSMFFEQAFLLASGMKLNVQPPPPNMVAPIHCELIKSSSKNEPDSKGDLGMLYLIDEFQTFEFVGDDIKSGTFPICIHLLSLTGDTLKAIPKPPVENSPLPIETPFLFAPQICPNMPITSTLAAQVITPQADDSINKNDESLHAHVENNYDFDGIFIIDYIDNPKDSRNTTTLHFKVNLFECEEFKMHLFDSVQRIQEEKDKKKKERSSGPRSLPERTKPALSPFESIFHSLVQSVKETFDIFTAPTSPKPEEGNQSKQISQSQKSIPGPVSDILNDSETDLAPKPRKSDEIKKRPFAASVLSKIKLNNGPSSILERIEEIDEIRSQFPYRFVALDWTLIYRLSKDGASYTAFYDSAYNAGPTVMIISTNTHDRIGAFLATGFKKSQHSYGSGECFVFRFVKQPPKPKLSSIAQEIVGANENVHDPHNLDNELSKNDEIQDGEILDKELIDQNGNLFDVDNNLPKEKSIDLIVNEPSPFPHIEVFKWNSSQSQSFISSQPKDIFIGCGNLNNFHDFAGNTNINECHGAAIYIGKDLLYASSSPCDTFHSPRLTRKADFLIQDIELWQIGVSQPNRV